MSNIRAVNRGAQGTEFLKAMTALLWPKWVGREGAQMQGKHPWPPVGKGETLLSREGFGAPGVWELSKLVLSKAGCAHIKAAQYKSWGDRKKNFFVY